MEMLKIFLLCLVLAESSLCCLVRKRTFGGEKPSKFDSNVFADEIQHNKEETIFEERSLQNNWKPLYSSVEIVDDFPYKKFGEQEIITMDNIHKYQDRPTTLNLNKILRANIKVKE